MRTLLTTSLVLCCSLPTAFGFPSFDPFTDATASGGTAYANGSALAGQTNALHERWALLNGGSSSQQVKCVNSNITYTGFPASFPAAPTNASVLLPGTVYSPVAAGYSAALILSKPVKIDPNLAVVNKVYASFLMQVPNVGNLATGGNSAIYFGGFATNITDQAISLPSSAMKLFVKGNSTTAGTSTMWTVGVSGNAGGSSTVFDSNYHTTNETILVVVDYEFGLSGTDVVNMWVNPDMATFGTTPPAPTATANITGTARIAQAADFYLLCRTGGTLWGAIVLGDLRVGDGWSYVTGGPGITAAPVNRTNATSTTATFSVTAISGSQNNPLSYKWQRNGSNLSDSAHIVGSSTSSLTISSVTTGDVGTYSVIVTNIMGAVTNSATLTVIDDPQITTQPVSVTNVAGTDATFSVAANGTAPIAYQWQKNGVALSDGGNISGSQTSSLTVAGISLADQGTYNVVVTGLNTLVSSNATLTALYPIAITSPVQPRTVRAGDKTVFAVGVTGTALNYQWSLNGTPIAGATQSAYTINNVQLSDAGNYSVLVSNALNNVTSSATLTVSSANLNWAPTNLVVLRMGNGAQPLSSTSGNSIAMDEFAPDGSYLSSVSIPDSGATSIIVPGNTNEGVMVGLLTRSADTQFLNFAGCNVAWPYGGNLATDASSKAPRSVGAVDGLGYYKNVLTNTTLYSPNRQFRGAVSTEGTYNFWTSGSGAGAKYFNPTYVGGIPTVSPSWEIRGLGIYDTNFYYIGATIPYKGLYSYPGLPMTNDTTTYNTILTLDDSSDPQEFALSPDRNTIYVTDARDIASGGGIQRWDNNGGGFTLTYTLGTGSASTFGARGLLVDFANFTGTGSTGTGAVIYATTAEPSTNHLIRVEDTGSASTATDMAVAGVNQLFRGVQFAPIALPIAIAGQPQSQTNLVGTTATFTLDATGSGRFYYQWMLNGTNIIGATNGTLTLTNVQMTDTGSYSVTVSNDISTATSSTATLTVAEQAPIIVFAPQSRVLRVGGNVAFVVGVIGSQPMSYQWQFNGNPISGATDSSYLVSSAQLADAGNYSVSISNAAGNTNTTASLGVSSGLLHFSSTNLVVSRVGDGAQTLNNTSGNTLYLDQLTPTGNYVSTLMVPDSGANTLVVEGSGIQGVTESVLNLSTDQRFINFAGYHVPRPYGGVLSVDSGSLAPRTIGAVNGLGYFALALTNTGLYSPARQIRGAASTEGLTSFWTSGSAAGVKYVTPKMGASGVPQPSPTIDVRATSLFANNVYYTTASATNGLFMLPGLVTNSADAATATLVLSSGFTNSSPNEFAVSPDGKTIYLADDRALSDGGGIQRWDDDGAGFNLTYTLGTGAGSTVGARGLLIDFSGVSGTGSASSGARLYATTAETSTNRLIGILDTGANSSAALLAWAGPNQLLRSVRFAPVADPASIVTPASDLTATAGSTVTLSVAVAGSMPITYQWKKNGTNLVDGANIAGANSATLTLVNIAATDAGTYSLFAANDLATVSSSATLTVATPAHFDSFSFISGTNAAFQMTISGASNSTYRIDGSTNLIDWVVLSQFTNTTGTFQFVDPADTNSARFYRAVWVP